MKEQAGLLGFTCALLCPIGKYKLCGGTKELDSKIKYIWQCNMGWYIWKYISMVKSYFLHIIEYILEKITISYFESIAP